MSKKVLLIGGSGFLGSALRRTFSNDAQFEVWYSSTHAESNSRHLKIDLIAGSGLERIREFDIVVNLTGQFVHPLSRCFSLNTKGMWNLLQSLDSEKQTLIQISTTLVYGTVQTATEDLPLDPEFPYAAGKAAAEFLAQTALPPTTLLIVRLSNLYGTGQSKGLLWYLVDCIRRNKDISIADNNGELRRYFLHVDDASRLIHELIVSGATGVVNMPGPEMHSIKGLVSLCEKILGRPLPAVYATTSPRGNIDTISSDRLQSLIPVRYEHSVEEYLRQSLV